MDLGIAYHGDLVEFLGIRRCEACQQGNRKCIINESDEKCMLCSDARRDCVFERALRLIGPKASLGWAPLVQEDLRILACNEENVHLGAKELKGPLTLIEGLELQRLRDELQRLRSELARARWRSAITLICKHLSGARTQLLRIDLAQADWGTLPTLAAGVRSELARDRWRAIRKIFFPASTEQSPTSHLQVPGAWETTRGVARGRISGVLGSSAQHLSDCATLVGPITSPSISIQAQDSPKSLQRYQSFVFDPGMRLMRRGRLWDADDTISPHLMSGDPFSSERLDLPRDGTISEPSRDFYTSEITSQNDQGYQAEDSDESITPRLSVSLRCDFRNCDHVSKNPSEAKKHRQRHIKPYKCAHCSKPFSTQNDLDRHEKSVHRIAARLLPSRAFRCAAPDCNKKDKIWPRLDNFRQHCQRIHKDDNLDDLIKKSELNDAPWQRGKDVPMTDQPTILGADFHHSYLESKQLTEPETDQPTILGGDFHHSYLESKQLTEPETWKPRLPVNSVQRSTPKVPFLG